MESRVVEDRPRTAGVHSPLTIHAVYLFLFLNFFKRFAFFLNCFLPNFFMRLLFSILLCVGRLCPMGASVIDQDASLPVLGTIGANGFLRSA